MDSFKPIQGINQQLNPIQSLSKASPVKPEEAEGDKKYSFANIMAKQVGAVNKTLDEVGEARRKFMTGELKNTHDLAVAGQKAGIMLRLTTFTCSKVASSCTTLFQMQI